jgi:hypothetical protein
VRSTCRSSADASWVADMLAALEYIRRRANDQAASNGESTRACTCCRTLKPVSIFRKRIDSRYPGKTLTVATCGDCERGYCRIDVAHRSSVKQDRKLRIREEKLAESDPEFAAARDRERRMVASRLAHGFTCVCEGCRG